MFSFILLCCILPIFLYYYWYIPKSELMKKVRNLPTPKKYPVIGNLIYFLKQKRSTWEIFLDLLMKYQRLVCIWYGPTFVIYVHSPKDVEIIIKSSKEMEKGTFYKFFKPWFGDVLLFNYGETFEKKKKISMRSFHSGKLREYLKIFNSQAETLVKNLKTNVDKEFDIDPHINIFTLQILLETVMGVNSDNKLMSPADVTKVSHATEKVCYCVFQRMARIWLYPDIIFNFSQPKKTFDKYKKVLDQLTSNIVRRKIEEMKSSDDKISNSTLIEEFLKNMMDEERPVYRTIEDVKNETMAAVFAGHDTTSSALGFALSLLGVHQEVQEKVYIEIVEVFGLNGRIESLEDAQKLSYMEQVIQETLRLYPSVPFIGRKPLRDIHLDGGYVLPKDCDVIIPLFLLHRNSHFLNAEDFNPDNFSPNNIKDRSSYGHIPFSTNYRACLGTKYAILTIKVFLSIFLRDFKIYSRLSEKEFKIKLGVTLKRKEGFLIKLEKRT